MRSVRTFLLLSAVLAACAPPPRVAGYSQTEGPAPLADPARPVAAPPKNDSPLVPASLPGPAGTSGVEPPAAPTPPAAKPPPTLAAEDQLGQPGGFALEALSPSGSYVAYCQPVGTTAQKPIDQRLDERGNADGPVSLTLAIGTERFDIDEVLATDPTGRFVVTLESGTAILRDTVEHKSFPLTALAIDLERDALPDHRSVAFSVDGQELALLTKPAGGEPRLDILDLRAADPTLTPRTVNLAPPSATVGAAPSMAADAAAPRPWRVFAEADSFVLASVPPSGKGPGWPVRAWSQPNLRCTRGTFDAFARVSGPLRDPALSHVLILRGRTAVQPAPGFVMATSGGWIRREDDGRLLVVQGKQQRQLASARCGGRILAADSKTGWFLVSCEEYRPVKREEPKPASSKKRPPPPKVRFPLYLLKPGVVRDLDAELMRSGVDMPQQSGSRYVAVRVEAGLMLVDFVKGRAEVLEPADRVLMTTDSEAILSSGGRLVRYTDGKRLELGTLRALDPVVTLRGVEQNGNGGATDNGGPKAPNQRTAAFAAGSTLYVRRMDKGGDWEATVLPHAPLALTKSAAIVPTETETARRWARGSAERLPFVRPPAP